VQDDRALRDRRQAVLHPVGEDGAGRRPQVTVVPADSVPRGEGAQADRLVDRVAERSEGLPARAPPARVDRRAGEKDRADPFGPLDRELGHDLATHRVADERRALQTQCVEPFGERRRVTPDRRRARRFLTPPVAR
jgi:hypothetical protein